MIWKVNASKYRTRCPVTDDHGRRSTSRISSPVPIAPHQPRTAPVKSLDADTAF
jgi:hypothetical protein